MAGGGRVWGAWQLPQGHHHYAARYGITCLSIRYRGSMGRYRLGFSRKEVLFSSTDVSDGYTHLCGSLCL